MTQGQNSDADVIRWKNGWCLMEKCAQSGILDDATFPSDTSIFHLLFHTPGNFLMEKVGLMENLLT